MTFKELLKERDVSAAQLSRWIGVSKTTITNWKDGKCSPAIKYVVKIAERLAVSTETVCECFKKGA